MSRGRVLIVDDEAELVPTLVERLELRGFDADGVLDGAEAIERLKERDFDVVVLDVHMPGIGGLEVTRRLRREQPEVKVLLLSGHVSREEERKGLEAGALAYLVKPLDIEELVRTIRDAIEKEA